MCGIFGISVNPKNDKEPWTPSEMAQIMFPEIIHRGPHAFGWMWYQDEKQVWTFKREGRCDTQESLDRMNKIPDDVKWLVCHVRYATHGSPAKLINNHPIQHKNILGVHNGVLRNHNIVLNKTGRFDNQAEVDSEAIFAAVNKWGHEKGLAKIQGDMVAVYTDLRRPNTLNIARSYGRPLVFATTEAGNLIFASEASVIEALGIQHTPFKSFVSENILLKVRSGKIRERRRYVPKPMLPPPLPPSKRVFTPSNKDKKQWEKDIAAAVERDKKRQALGHRGKALQKPPKNFVPIKKKDRPRGDALSDPLSPEEVALLQQYEEEFYNKLGDVGNSVED